jgi:hypothetical protein
MGGGYKKNLAGSQRALPDFSTSVVEFLCAIAFSIQKLFLVLPVRPSNKSHHYL